MKASLLPFVEPTDSHPSTRDRRLSPLDRLLDRGAAALLDEELLALLLDRSEERGLRQASSLLERCPFERLFCQLDARVLEDAGLGQSLGGGRILAALELARRQLRPASAMREPLNRPEALAAYLHYRYWEPDQEIAGAIFLDAQSRPINDREIFRGTLARCACEPRAILKLALECSAAKIVLFHSHPSGDPSPSESDLVFTRKLVKSGEVLGIPIVDHLILGSPGRWRSLRGAERSFPAEKRVFSGASR